MARADLGRKHSCASCGSKFYDLGRKPATCPACETVVQAAEEGSRSKRPAQVLRVAAEVEGRKVGAGHEGRHEREDLSADIESGGKKVVAGRGMIEDLSELGEDQDDVVRVVGETDERD